MYSTKQIRDLVLIAIFSFGCSVAASVLERTLFPAMFGLAAGFATAKAVTRGL
jgi:hypothetical protein